MAASTFSGTPGQFSLMDWGGLVPPVAGKGLMGNLESLDPAPPTPTPPRPQGSSSGAQGPSKLAAEAF